MEQIALRIALAGESLFYSAWLPLLIWTVIGSIAWLILKSTDRIQPEHQYHTRLALIFALPMGFLLLMILEYVSLFLNPAAAESALKIISVPSPVEFGFTPAESTPGIPVSYWFYLAIALTLAAGLMVTFGRFFVQCLRLRKLRAQCELIPIKKIEGLNSSNLGLSLAIRRQITVSFIEQNIVPVTFGRRKPVILLPGSLRSDHRKMNLAIRHELTHIHQHDFLTHILVIVTEALFWFHPLVHRLKHELVEYREMRCDRLVLNEKSVSRREYSLLLLELIPMPNIDKNLSVNMAQESSNLKKRITMITQYNQNEQIPKRTSLALLSAIFLSTAIVMACTDMQTQTVFDEEELNIITDVDHTGNRGYHQILIYLSNEEQAERHKESMDQLRSLMPDHVRSFMFIPGDEAVEEHGERASNGVIQIRTNLDPDSYNRALVAMGFERQEITVDNLDDPEDYFVVVEEMPELIGGLAELQRKIRYPQMARRAGIEGRVYVQFIVNEQGEVERPQVIRGIGGGADEEALRVVSEANFKPGYQRGRPVRVQYSLPIFFRLQGSENTPEQTPINDVNSLSEITVSGYNANSSPSSPSVEPEVIGRDMTVRINRNGSTITGTVEDGITGQPLSGANVVLEGINRGSATNMNGEFTLTNVTGEATHVNVTFIGYQARKIEL